MTSMTCADMMVARLTPSEVAARFEEAADTLRRLSVPDLQQRVARWPTILREAKAAYGYSSIEPKFAPPSAAAIDRMDQTILWLDWLELDDLRLVWARAERLPWKRISWMFGISRTTAWQRWMATMMVVSARIDAEGSGSNGSKLAKPKARAEPESPLRV